MLIKQKKIQILLEPRIRNIKLVKYFITTNIKLQV